MLHLEEYEIGVLTAIGLCVFAIVYEVFTAWKSMREE
jgi:hypothetical protein